MKKVQLLLSLWLIVFTFFKVEAQSYDIVVYGATASGGYRCSIRRI